MSNSYDVIVVGSGPAGYVCAIKLAQLGKQVCVVEKDKLGGTCLNRGCIPTKALLHVSQLRSDFDAFKNFAPNVEEPKLDEAAIDAYKTQIVDGQRAGVEGLIKANGIDLKFGKAKVISQTKVELINGDVNELLEAKEAIVLAAGSTPLMIPIKGIEHCYSSDDLLEGESKQFDSLTIIGGGVIGAELASYYAGIGKEVTVVEALDRLIARMDKDASSALSSQLKLLGVKVQVKSSVKSVSKEGDTLITSFEDKKGELQEIRSDAVLCAVGRRAASQDLWSEDLNIECEHGFIKVDENFETSQKDIFAIGDIRCGSKQLAHEASFEAELLAEYLCGTQKTAHRELVPSVIYSSPEIASIGTTEEEAKASGLDYLASKYVMGGNARVAIANTGRSFIKVLVEEKSYKLLGATIVSEHASEMINELSLGLSKGLSVDDMCSYMHPHPSFGEGLTEVLQSVKNEAIHVPPRKK